MKLITDINKYILRFESVFRKAETIPEAIDLLASAYQDIKTDHPYFHSFQLSSIDTKSIQCQVYYQTPIGITDRTIKVHNTDYDGYIWKDEDGWCIDDVYWGAEKVSKELVNSRLFTGYPENVKELKALLVGGYWELCSNLPKFSERPPADIKEVLSWDDRFVLVGTELANLAIMSRYDWDNLCERENNWFDK